MRCIYLLPLNRLLDDPGIYHHLFISTSCQLADRKDPHVLEAQHYFSIPAIDYYVDWLVDRGWLAIAQQLTGLVRVVQEFANDLPELANNLTDFLAR